MLAWTIDGLVESDLLVGLAQQALETQQHSLDIVGGGPLVLQDVEADAT